MSDRDRRPSLIDQMAMVAASQLLLEEGLDDSSEEDSDMDADIDHDSLDSAKVKDMFFRTDLESCEEDGEEAHDFSGNEDSDDDYRMRNMEDGGSTHSPAHSEEMDTFGDNPTSLLSAGWARRGSVDDSAVSSCNMSSSSDNWDTSERSDDMARTPSFRQRRSSYQSETEMSRHSAPARTGYDSSGEIGGQPRTMYPRPASIAVPYYDGGGGRRNSYSKRRTSVNVKSFSGGDSTSPMYPVDEQDDGSSRSNPNARQSASGILGFGRRSTRRQNLSIKVRQGAMGNLDNAIESLRKQDSNSEWENVAAAVTVVAASSQAPTNSKTRHLKFAVNDTVLVFLTLLNVTNMDDPKDTFTVAPVNKYGFPAGEGRTEAEKSGPYTFVLASVKYVHFDEDDRYYTVIRADTGTEQRADSGWMEPLTDPEGMEAAQKAAKRTVRSTQDKPIEDIEDTGYLQDCCEFIIDVISWPADFSRSTLLPWYQKQRAKSKQRILQLLYGDSPFACKVRVTGINFLVSCSFVFLFLEVINLAFLPASYDKEIAIVGVVVWCILVLELIFEVLIRPKGYFELIESDKAFAPSTARHINRFHLVFETLALLTFLPEFQCLSNHEVCSRATIFSRVSSSLDAVLGDSHAAAARGRFLMGITALRFFGVVRHWKQMWINNTFHPTSREGLEKWLFPPEKAANESMRVPAPSNRQSRWKKDDASLGSFASMYGEESTRLALSDSKRLASSEEDQRLKNAGTIGTALMVVNSQRALILLTAIVLVLPLLDCLTQQNEVAPQLIELLQGNNIAAQSDCVYLETAISSWLNLAVVPQPVSVITHASDTFVLWARVLPVRCDFQSDDGVITQCDTGVNSYAYSNPQACQVWGPFAPANASDATPEYFASELNIRVDGILTMNSTFDDQYPDYSITVIYNENPTISLANMGLFFLLFGNLILGLYGLQALRRFAFRLVLDPLQRMLKIVLRYAENPLSQDVREGARSSKTDDSVMDNEGEEIGNYETEQLINAITKIADLLRKCWGVAGAGIISSNLARTKDGKTVVFNPTVPGKRVYALFGFVAINGFSEQLRALDRDVMILINDVAKVVHDEVYRWALGDHGQCNKNLGEAFLMVFRIGDFSEVQKKKRVATEKLFRDTNVQKNTKRANLRRRTRSNLSRAGGRRQYRNQDGEGQLQLASLPGIQSFTDRALLGMLKSFAGVHRDKNLTVWKNDFRLSAGVSAYHVDIIYGMDAGWAVEGAVGSEYKIDATYLSPHVNMASRMMSATKQYGVTILLSKAVEELLSRTCRKKLRHLDTVYVKGSKVKQDIFTYDARHKGVDFFLMEKTPEQADVEAESYTPNIWDTDPDVRAMRQHVSDAFMDIFSLAVKQYLGGNWVDAHKNFEKADNKMIENVLEDGYLDYDLEEIEGRIFDKNDNEEDIVRIRQELGDGACRVLMSYMERRNLKAPDDWDAVRQLNSK